MLFVCCYGAFAQYNDGPVPPRLLIPGAISLGPKPSGGFRQGRLLVSPPQGQQTHRIRRPGQLRAGAFKSVPSPTPFLQQLDDTPKPVNEESDDIENNSTPQPFVSSALPYLPSPQQQLTEEDAPQVFINPTPIVNNYPAPQAAPTRPPQEQVRPTPPARPQQSIDRYEAPVRQNQPVRLAPLSYRPARPQFRPEARPQEDEEQEPVRQQAYRQPIQRPQQQAAPAPAPAKYSSNTRERKPVAQVIRKYRDDNPDGSITWGFENDDGSFKEETIGIDCVTRGRYGYVDPDGLKRDYSYETGIPCDKAKEEQAEQGFIDYQENKAVLPNGIVLDLANMGKKSKRPRN